MLVRNINIKNNIMVKIIKNYGFVNHTDLSDMCYN